MEKTLLERLKEVRKDYDVAHVCYFNDGKVRKDENYSAKRINHIDSKEQFKAIEDVLASATSSYARSYEFDTINMNLLLGLIFNQSDVDENDQVKENAQPINGVVRYYTGSVKSFSEGKQTNPIDYGEYGPGRQGYISFDKLMKFIEASGLTYVGPETFEELKEQILAGNKFPIFVSAELTQKETSNQITK